MKQHKSSQQCASGVRSGRTLVELWRDVAFRLTPVSDIDASEMLASLRASRLLDGYRGSLPADREALMAVILRISAMVESIPELQELALNPVTVLPPGQGAIVIDGRLRLAPRARPGAARNEAARAHTWCEHRPAA